LEDAFWKGLKEIAAGRDLTLSEMVSAIDTGRASGNLSSAIRLFVLDHYRTMINPAAPKQDSYVDAAVQRPSDLRSSRESSADRLSASPPGSPPSIRCGSARWSRAAGRGEDRREARVDCTAQSTRFAGFPGRCGVQGRRRARSRRRTRPLCSV